MKEEDASFNYGYRIFSLLGSGPSHKKVASKDSRFTKILEKAFSRERYTHFAKVTRAGLIDYMSKNWNKDVQHIDLFSEMYSLNIRLIIRSFMGEFEEENVKAFIETVKFLDLEERIKSVKTIIHNYFPSERKAMEHRWNMTVNLVKELVASRKEDSVEFFDFLVENSKDDNGLIDYPTLTSRVFATLFAAALNTFATSSWLLFRVFDNPQILEEVKKEQQEYLELLNKPDTDIGQILINKFPYTEKTIREVIRTSTAGVSFRRAVRDFVLDNKYTVPKDTFIITPYISILRDSSVFSDPNQFKPERFDVEGKGSCENVIFGAGRHPCTGMKFAILNIKNIVFNVMEYYDVETPGKAEDYMPNFQNMGVFRPIKPVLFTLKKKDGSIKQ